MEINQNAYYKIVATKLLIVFQIFNSSDGDISPGKIVILLEVGKQFVEHLTIFFKDGYS